MLNGIKIINANGQSNKAAITSINMVVLFFDKLSSCLSLFVIIVARINVIMDMMNGKLISSGIVKRSINVSPLFW